MSTRSAAIAEPTRREQLGTAPARDEADRYLGQAQHGAVVGDDQVAREGDLEAAPEGEASDGGDCGNRDATSAPNMRRMSGRCSSISASLNMLRSLRSAPTQKARSFEEAITTARMTMSWPTASATVLSCRAISLEIGVKAPGPVQNDLGDVALHRKLYVLGSVLAHRARMKFTWLRPEVECFVG